MEKKDDGGPAFPCPVGEQAGWPGLSLRDYFIAHAPAEPQFWFEPAMPTERPKSRWVSDGGTQEFKSAFEAERVCGDNFRDANGHLIDEWDFEKKKQRYIQWPAAWADAQLEARKK